MSFTYMHTLEARRLALALARLAVAGGGAAAGARAAVLVNEDLELHFEMMEVG